MYHSRNVDSLTCRYFYDSCEFGDRCAAGLLTVWLWYADLWPMNGWSNAQWYDETFGAQVAVHQSDSCVVWHDSMLTALNSTVRRREISAYILCSYIDVISNEWRLATKRPLTFWTTPNWPMTLGAFTFTGGPLRPGPVRSAALSPVSDTMKSHCMVVSMNALSSWERGSGYCNGTSGHCRRYTPSQSLSHRNTHITNAANTVSNETKQEAQ